jgi:hypothetical protein
MSEPVKPDAAAVDAVPTVDALGTGAPAPAQVANLVVEQLLKLGLSVEHVSSIVKLGVESVDDLSSLQEKDLVDVGVPVIKARKVVNSFKVVAPAPAPAASVVANNSFDILPVVPDDKSWLASLRAEGVLRVGQSTVIAAIRAALADKYGLFDVNKKIVEAMESFVDETEEQVGPEYFAILKQLKRKTYGDIFEAVDGLDGNFVTDTRKRALLSKIDKDVWPAIIAFNDSLASWQQTWNQSYNNPQAMMSLIGSLANGGRMPPGAMPPPDCGFLRDAAESVNSALNRAFRGTGKQITAALAYEANQIKAVLENNQIPLLCGVANRELLFKKLGVAVPATYPRMETNLTRFVTSILNIENVSAGDDELSYFSSLFALGSQIPWGQLGSETPEWEDKPLGIGGGALRRPARNSGNQGDDDSGRPRFNNLPSTRSSK